MITTCLQTSGSSSVWADCSRVQEAHQPLAQAEEDGVRLPGHDHADDYVDVSTSVDADVGGVAADDGDGDDGDHEVGDDADDD